MEETIEKVPTVQDKINTALDGRTQTWLVSKIKDYAEGITVDDLEAKYKLTNYTDVILSRKMNKRDAFEQYELKAISKILKIKL